MPLYEFCCEACEETIEVLQKYTDDPPEHCDLPMKRVLSGGRVGLDFRGAGWYVNDYAPKSKPKEP
jgi:putative FmdB family regulatory protein